MITLATLAKIFCVFFYGQMMAKEAEAKIWRMLYERDRRYQHSPPPAAIEDGVASDAEDEVLAICSAPANAQAARLPCPAPEEDASCDPNPACHGALEAGRATTCQAAPGSAAGGQHLLLLEEEDCGFVIVSPEAMKAAASAVASAPSALPDVPQVAPVAELRIRATAATAPTRQQEQSLAASCAW